jgi:hypothetical protein
MEVVKMLKRTIMVVTLGLFLGMDLAAEEGTKTLSEATFTLTLSQEGTDTYVLNYKSEEEIVDVIWDEATITVSELRERGIKALEKRATETVRIRYPKVVMIKDERALVSPLVKTIQFFDKRGRIKKEMALQRWILYKQDPAYIFLSKNKEYICISTPEPLEIPEDYKGPIEYYKPPRDPEIESVILNTDGEELWRATSTLSGGLWLSPNGRYFIVCNVECGRQCPLFYFNHRGTVKELWFKEGTMGFEYIEIDFSKDGSWFAVVGKNIGEHLVVFDQEANELWRKEGVAEGDWDVWELEISNDEIIIVTISRCIIPGKKIQLIEYQFTKQGELIETKEKEVER